MLSITYTKKQLERKYQFADSPLYVLDAEFYYQINVTCIWESSNTYISITPEDVILSEHVEEPLPHELCDIPWQFVVFSQVLLAY
jgi:hypothetical protein